MHALTPLHRTKCMFILPTILTSHYSTRFDWRNVFAKSEGENRPIVDANCSFSPSRFKLDFLERIQTQSLDDYSRRAVKGISDAVTKGKGTVSDAQTENVQTDELSITDEGKSIYDKVPEVFAAFQMSLADNKLKASISKMLEKNSTTTIENSGLGFPQKLKKADMYDIIPSSVLDEKTKGYIRELSALGDRLRSQFDKCTMNLQHPFPINLGLLRLYILHLATEARVEASRAPPMPCPISETFLSEAKYFLRFAADVYDRNPYISSDDVLLDQLGEHPKLSANVKIPRHIVFLDHLTKSVVISIRGTGSVSDILTDLHLDARPFLRAKLETAPPTASSTLEHGGEEEVNFFKTALERAASKMQATLDRQLGKEEGALFAHRGMADSAHALLGPVVAAIHEAHSRRGGRYRDYKIVVTGHSLGAGTGSLLAMLVAAHTSLPVKTFAFAPPPVLSREAYPLERHDHDPSASAGVGTSRAGGSSVSPSDLPSGGVHSNCVIHSFIHHNDVVPRASHFELLNLLSAIGSVDTLPWTPTDRSLLLLRGKLTVEEAALMKEHLAKAENYHQENEGVELCVPGHIYWLQPIVADTSISSNSREVINDDTATPSVSALKRYRVQQISDSRKLFNGYLYTGDSMVADHLVDYYMAAILNIDSTDKIK